ncbi:MAG: 4-hydroxy-3-methylbut-2-enyl diphosphate reductase [Bacillota bacterium]
MLIYKGETGFCSGVQNAIDKALESKVNHKIIYTLGNIIHNKRVVRGLEGVGILPINDIKALNNKDLIVICSHGTDKATIDKLNEKGVEVVDGTCPFVKKIHEKVYEYSQNGYNIVIIGDKDHTEVKGIAGWCMGEYQIIQSEKEMDFLPAEKFLVVSQTTFPVYKYRLIKKNLKKIGDKLFKIVVFFDSICYTTEGRQKEAGIIADKSDLVLVLGDKSSSNTNKLAQVAKEKCSNTHLISKVSDLESVQIKNISKLGIVSGASTPEELITEVINRMSETMNNDNLEIKDVNPTGEATEETAEPKKNETNENKEMSMSEGLKRYAPKSYREGMRLKARVVSADYNGILVALESLGKNDSGFIDRDEVELKGEYNPENYKPDDIIDVIIIPKKDKNVKFINLSKKAYDELKIDDEKVKGILAGDEFTLECKQEVKGGLLGKIGTYTVFVPASQIRMGFVKNLSDYLNKPLRLKALPPKEELDEEGNPKRARNPKRIVASQRIVLEEEKLEKEEDFWNSIPEGSVVSGKVKRFAAFGAFVSLKFMDALVHNSELSWNRKKINSPDEVLELNKTYDF